MQDFNLDDLERQARDIIDSNNVLDAFAQGFRKLVEGEETTGKLVFIAATSRLARRSPSYCHKGTFRRARVGGKDRGLFLKNGVWWGRWTCPYGQVHREKGGTRSLARQLYERRKTAVRHEGFCLDEARARKKREADSSFDRVAKRYLEWSREHRPRSVRFREGAMIRLTESFGGQNLTRITARKVETHCKRRLDLGMRPGTINRERAVLSHMFTMAIRWGLCSINPIRDTEQLREDNINPRPITQDEEQRLLAVLPDHHKAVVIFALNTGLRMGKIQSKRWEDVDLSNGTLVVTRPKSGKREPVPLNTTAFAVLAAADRSGILVFPRMPKDMSKTFRWFADKAGVDATFHDLRDTFISRIAESASPATVMTLATHRDFRTTQRYLRLDDDHLRAAVENLVDTQTGASSGTTIVTDISNSPQSTDSFAIG